MKTLSERLNLTTDIRDLPQSAIIFNTRKDIAIYDTLCMYCNNNDINLIDIDNNDFTNTSELISDYKKSSSQEYEKMAF